MYLICLIISIGLVLLYRTLIRFIIRQWQSQPLIHSKNKLQKSTSFSVIIAARNEERHISDCIRSVINGDYPREHYEIIVVNDHSTDGTSEVLSAFADQIKVLELDDVYGKKQAISLGVREANHEHIIITDADCKVPPDWLKNYSIHFQSYQDDFITGPLLINEDDDLCSAFQSMDTIGTIGVTQAGLYSGKWFMANGANMAFTRTGFKLINGFEKSNEWASGDDMFLVEQFARKGKSGFLKSSNPVLTHAESDWSGLYRQRIRWATKNRSYDHPGVTSTLGFVFIYNLLLLLSIPVAMVGSIKWFWIFLILFIGKMIIDFRYLSMMTRFFDQESRMKWFLPSFILYSVYISWIGIASFFVKKYTWKGREVK